MRQSYQQYGRQYHGTTDKPDHGQLDLVSEENVGERHYEDVEHVGRIEEIQSNCAAKRFQEQLQYHHIATILSFSPVTLYLFIYLFILLVLPFFFQHFVTTNSFASSEIGLLFRQHHWLPFINSICSNLLTTASSLFKCILTKCQ